MRPDALAAERGVLLEPQTLLDIRATLRQATTLHRIIGRLGGQFPRLADVADRLEECTALQHEIGRVLDETGEIMDSASPKLATVRREMRIAFDRLQDKLHNIINNTNNATYLQEKLITQRHGRYVIPLRAEFKGRIPGIVHDQSSSGATLFIEPLSTVELNNTWRDFSEENEIRRILRGKRRSATKLHRAHRRNAGPARPGLRQSQVRRSHRSRSAGTGRLPRCAAPAPAARCTCCGRATLCLTPDGRRH